MQYILIADDNKEFCSILNDYLLNQREVENIVSVLAVELTGKTLRDMFESYDRKMFANQFLSQYILDEVKQRKIIRVPSNQEMEQSLREVLEEIADIGNE